MGRVKCQVLFEVHHNRIYWDRLVKYRDVFHL